MQPLGPVNGPTVDMPTASKPIYEMQQIQMQLMDPWATSVSEAITDHAQHRDRHRDKVQGHHVQSNISFEKLRQELASSVARHDLVESDLHRVHDEDKGADLMIRSELDDLSVATTGSAPPCLPCRPPSD